MKKRLFTLFLALIMMFSFTIPSFSASAATPEKQKLISYLPGWQDWTVDDIQGDKLTHLYISFARIDNGFKISDKESRLTIENRPDLPIPDIASSALVKESTWAEIDKVREKYPNLKIIIAVGGWAADGFSDMVKYPTNRQIFVDSVVKYVEKHKLDGVDIDWEYPVNGGWGVIKAREADKANFTALVKLLRKSLGADKEISFCASIGGWFIDSVDLKSLVPLIDSVNIMGYDYNGSWSGTTAHHTNLYPSPNDPTVSWGQSTSESVERFLKAGVPANKIVMGFAAYGKEFNGVKAGAKGDGLFQEFDKADPASWRGGSIPYHAIKDYYIGKYDFVRYWDDAAKAPYLYSKTWKVFVSYEDTQSVKEKGMYAKEKGLGGVMYWEYTNDSKGELLNAMSDTLYK